VHVVRETGEVTGRRWRSYAHHLPVKLPVDLPVGSFNLLLRNAK
jgi:hypothetical protein